MMLRMIGVSVLIGFGLIVAQAYEGDAVRGLTLRDAIQRVLESSHEVAAAFDRAQRTPLARAEVYAGRGSD